MPCLYNEALYSDEKCVGSDVNYLRSRVTGERERGRNFLWLMAKTWEPGGWHCIYIFHVGVRVSKHLGHLLVFFQGY